MSSPSDPATDAAAKIEQADLATVRAAASWRHQPIVKVLGFASELADQPPLASICAATLATGLVRRDRRLARAGARMLAAHALATLVKSAVKAMVIRTRPRLLVEEGRYELKPGQQNEGPVNSFPSGHTAGALAVARALGREYPGTKAAGYVATVAVAAIQVPRCNHYPSDTAAGALVGLAAEAVVDRAVRAIDRRREAAPRAEPSARDIRIG